MWDAIAVWALLSLLVGLPTWLNDTVNIVEACKHVLVLDRRGPHAYPCFYDVFFAYRRENGSATALASTMLTVYRVPIMGLVVLPCFIAGMLRMASKDLRTAWANRGRRKEDPKRSAGRNPFFSRFAHDLRRERRSRRIHVQNERLWDRLVNKTK